MTKHRLKKSLSSIWTSLAIASVSVAFFACNSTHKKEIILPRGKSAISNDLKTFKLRGKHQDWGKISFVNVNGMPFKKALRIETFKSPKKEWDVQLSARNKILLKRGDIILVSFYARTIKSENESGTGQSTFLFEKGSPPWTKSIILPYAFSSEWGRYSIPFRVNKWGPEIYPKGTASMAFNLGFKPQIIEIADIKCETFDDKTAFSSLPRIEPYSSYKGRDPKAEWRKKAAKRIKKIRKSNIAINVKDKWGNSIKDAKVSLKMKRHAFIFGSCISSKYMHKNPETTKNGKRYREEIKKLFNQVVFEGGMKWLGWIHSREKTMAAVKWTVENSIPVRGHTLVWPSWKMSGYRYQPEKIKYFKKNPDKLQEAILEHVKDETSSLKKVVFEWDVINEPYTNNDIIKLLGDKAMIGWLKKAKESAPKARMMINDFGILAAGNQIETEHQKYYENLIKFFIDNGAPLEGIGMQSHFCGNVLTEPENIFKILGRFEKFKKTIVITEYDFTTNNEELQADYTHDFMTAIFSHPYVEGFLMWGFWDGRHWTNNAPIYRKDWTLKPSGKVYKDLVFKEWWTNESGETNGKGEFRTRGFLGDYELTVNKNGKQKKFDFKLGKKGETLNIILE